MNINDLEYGEVGDLLSFSSAPKNKLRTVIYIMKYPGIDKEDCMNRIIRNSAYWGNADIFNYFITAEYAELGLKHSVKKGHIDIVKIICFRFPELIQRD